jgi:hypothetical protein
MSPPFGEHAERRWGKGGKLHSCRLCWKELAVDTEKVERTGPGEGQFFFRCPYCLGSFPIRRDDVVSPSNEETRQPIDTELTSKA